MSKEELAKAFRELYKLWHMQDTDEDIDYILSQVIKQIGKGE